MSNELDPNVSANPANLPATNNPANLPAFMQGETERLGLDEISRYVVPPRLKIVQPQSKPPLSEIFRKGDVVVSPVNVLVRENKLDEAGRPTDEIEPMYFTPIFFWAEFIAWNPIGSEKMFADRTLDPRSPLAAKCRDFDRHKELVPGKTDEFIRNREHLNFLIVIEGTDFEATPVIMSFASSEFKSGQMLSNLISMRRSPTIFGNRFEATIDYRPEKKGSRWYGFDVSNPNDRVPYVQDGDKYEHYRALHKRFAKAHADNLLRVDYAEGDATGEGEVAANDTGDGEF